MLKREPTIIAPLAAGPVLSTALHAACLQSSLVPLVPLIPHPLAYAVSRIACSVRYVRSTLLQVGPKSAGKKTFGKTLEFLYPDNTLVWTERETDLTEVNFRDWDMNTQDTFRFEVRPAVLTQGGLDVVSTLHSLLDICDLDIEVNDHMCKPGIF